MRRVRGDNRARVGVLAELADFAVPDAEGVSRVLGGGDARFARAPGDAHQRHHVIAGRDELARIEFRDLIASGELLKNDRTRSLPVPDGQSQAGDRRFRGSFPFGIKRAAEGPKGHARAVATIANPL